MSGILVLLCGLVILCDEVLYLRLAEFKSLSNVSRTRKGFSRSLDRTPCFTPRKFASHRRADLMSSDFPKRLGEKLKTIRLRLALTPDEIAQFVGAQDAAEIVAYEDDEGDMPVSVGLCAAFRQPDHEFDG